MTEIVYHRRRHREPTLTSAIKQARKAGLIPVGATMESDGKISRISLEFGKRDCENKKENDLDKWIAKHAN